MAKILEHGQQVRTTIDRYEPVILVGTAEGYAREYDEDGAEAYRREVEYGHPTAWTIASPSCLMDDYPGKGKALAVKAERYRAAVLLEDGEEVEIEKRSYKVQYNVIGCLYPVNFLPVS